MDMNITDKKSIKITLLALGCSKNLVDCETMSTLLKEAGYNVINDVPASDIVVINTCGFIESAKKEAIDAILDVADYKTPNGNVKKIIVSGCLSQRYPEDIIKELPEVDAVLGTAHYGDIVDIVAKLASEFDRESEKINLTTGVGGYKHLVKEREISTEAYAWLKIGEGCLNKCSFCAIPIIRGSFVSRPMEDIVEEAKIIASKGIKEIVLAAQDTTNYGIELYKERSLTKLLRKLSEIEGIELIRVMYGYMDGITPDLIEEMAKNPKVAHYLDIPIQHGCNKILKAMKRRDTAELITSRLEMIRAAMPDCIIRTTVMVGFPGETEEDFKELKDNLRKWKFDRLGCFIFSPEEGTKAFDMPDQIDDETKQRRYDEIYELQQQISAEQSQKRLGTVTRVNICSISDDGIFYVGRSYGEAPEVDPVIYVASQKEELKIGEFVDVKIADCSDDYDMTAVTIDGD
ncbi:MAG: 30S ribosomal protein S12 methylthiotransferase RimO [Saccharofermentans sp.]|nr:30S ribosomal protein S12 methylthiotransferase RimO [Saccharofermentans sp.]